MNLTRSVMLGGHHVPDTADLGLKSMGSAHIRSAFRQAIQQRVVGATFGKGQGQCALFNEMGQTSTSGTTNTSGVAVSQRRINQVFGSIDFVRLEGRQYILHSTADAGDKLSRVVLVGCEEPLYITSAPFGHELRDKSVGLKHGVYFLKAP